MNGKIKNTFLLQSCSHNAAGFIQIMKKAHMQILARLLCLTTVLIEQHVMQLEEKLLCN